MEAAMLFNHVVVPATYTGGLIVLTLTLRNVSYSIIQGTTYKIISNSFYLESSE